jgi:hypothetical protein
VLLVLWAATGYGTLASELFDLDPVALALTLIPNGIFFLALWFSLQWDIVHHFVPNLAASSWANNSFNGLMLGGIAGVGTGIGGIMLTSSLITLRLTIDADYFPFLPWILIAFAIAGVLIGFATFGWFQAREMRYDMEKSWWWVAVTALAWVPVPLAIGAYWGVLQLLVINIYPDLHLLIQVLLAESALLCPSMIAYAAVARRLIPPWDGTKLLSIRELPRTIVAGVLVPPTVVVLAFGGVLVGHALQVERAWVADSPVAYLGLTGDGQVVTRPSGGVDVSDYKLSDYSTDGTMFAHADKKHVALYTIAAGKRTLLHTIQVFSGPPPEDHYREDAINVVRFNPDATLLAVGTGQALEGDSFVNRSNDHAVHIWSVPDGKLLYALTEPEYSVRTLEWCPDGRYLAAGGGLENRYGTFSGDNLLRMWRFDGRQDNASPQPTLAHALRGHTSTIEALAWNADCTRLVSGDLRGTIVIWRIK